MKKPAPHLFTRRECARDLLTLVAAASVPSAGLTQSVSSDLLLESRALRVRISSRTGSVVGLTNKLSGEDITVIDHGFHVEALEFNLERGKMQLLSVQSPRAGIVVADYAGAGHFVTVTYTLQEYNSFLETKLKVRSASPFGWKRVSVSRLVFDTSHLSFVPYRHQKMITYFGRSSRGGIFTGMELPFDDSSLKDGALVLGYYPSLKVGANEEIETEAVYLGAYARPTGEQPEFGMPLRSESEAMLAMTRAILGPPRHGFTAIACGWWSELEQGTFRSDEQVAKDTRSIDFLADLGVNWVSDSHAWGGETEKMNKLGITERYKPGELVSHVYEHAKARSVSVTFWPTMNNTNPWSDQGQPFLKESAPAWLMYPHKRTLQGTMLTGRTFEETVQGNCIANKPFREWVKTLMLDGLGTGYFRGWAMDGDFFGGGGIVKPVDCPRADHDHLPGDSNYACERALAELTADIRKAHPGIYIDISRPPMDLGVFSTRNVDAVNPLDEFDSHKPLPGLSDQPINVALGDKIRTWSRIRVHRHFFPHYLDQPFVFVAPKSMGAKLGGEDWPSASIDYAMFSGISSSPNQVYYLPTKAGIPESDKRVIRSILAWSRKNERYLLVRKDLPDWPAVGKVDGSAHLIGQQGYVFLFNPNPTTLQSEFSLDESIGLHEGTQFRVAAEYPKSGHTQTLRRQDRLKWDVPAHSVVVLEIAPA
jgi:hypothetical protein